VISVPETNDTKPVQSEASKNEAEAEAEAEALAMSLRFFSFVRSRSA
jgi:hypothetical protein